MKKKTPWNKRDVTDDLYKAVIAYVEAKGGKLSVIGGVDVQTWPGDGEFKFRIAISCMGKKPNFAALKSGAK